MRTNALKGRSSPLGVNVNLKVMSTARAWAECVMLGISRASPTFSQRPPTKASAATKDEISHPGQKAASKRQSQDLSLGLAESKALLNHAAPARPSEDPHGHFRGSTRNAQPSAAPLSQMPWPRLSLQTFSLSFSSLKAEYSAVCRCSLSTRLSRSSRIFSSKVCCWFTRSVTRLEGHKMKADKGNQLHTGFEEPGLCVAWGPVFRPRPHPTSQHPACFRISTLRSSRIVLPRHCHL